MEIVNDMRSPIYIACSTFEGKLYGCVVTWVMPASMAQKHPALCVCFSNRSHTLKAAAASGRFSLCKIGPTLADAAFVFGSEHSEDFDKFSEVEYFTEDGLPVLKEALEHALCRVTDTQNWGDRVIVRADVVEEESSFGEAPLTPEKLMELLPQEKREKLERLHEKSVELDDAIRAEAGR